MTLLVLWDLDHTLLEVRDVSREAYEAGFEQVTGTKLERLAAMTGRTDRAIIAETLRLHGLPATDKHVSRVGEAIGAAYRVREAAVREKGRLLPGASRALHAVGTLPGAVQSVLTGNMRSIAEVKLATLGVIDALDMDAGAFGMDGTDRLDLLRRALQRSSVNAGVEIPPSHALVIGDTPYDVDAALRSGAQVLAVATGTTSIDDLRAAGATTVLDSLTDTDRVVRAVRRAFRHEDDRPT